MINGTGWEGDDPNGAQLHASVVLYIYIGSTLRHTTTATYFCITETNKLHLWELAKQQGQMANYGTVQIASPAEVMVEPFDADHVRFLCFERLRIDVLHPRATEKGYKRR